MMRRLLTGLVLGSILFLSEAREANAQVSWVWPHQFQSVGPTKQDFLNWLNYERSRRGLSSVSYDVSLEYECHQNNLWQAARGMGHYFMGRARRQNASAVQDFGKVGPCWMVSPGHYAALMDYNIKFIAITYYNGYTTFCGY